MSQAVVLGSGGATGGAWEIGVLKGLSDAGVDPARAALFVGSSVGAILACLIQSGQPVDQLYSLYASGAGPFSRTRVSPSAGPGSDERSDADRQYFQEHLTPTRVPGIPARYRTAARGNESANILARRPRRPVRSDR